MTPKTCPPSSAPRRLSFLAALLCALSLSAPAWAKIEGAIEDWGLGGAVKAGSWCPLYVELKSTHEDFKGVLEVEVVAGQDTVPLFVKPLILPADTPTRHWVYFRSPVALYDNPGFRFHWRVLDTRGRARLRREWTRSVIASAGDTVIAVMRTAGVERAGLDALLTTDAVVRIHPLLVSPPLAPDRAIGYAAADAIVWINPVPSAFALTDQAEAIVDYVRQGGHLVIAVADGWQAVAQSFLADLVPAELAGSFLGGSLPALGAFGAPTGPIVLARMSSVSGKVLMDAAGAPVVVRGELGLGRVTLIAFDPTKAPFADLKRREAFWADILGLDADVSKDERRGREDVSGMLLRPLNDFPGFKPINFVFVGIFLAVYVILIGPVDYFLLKRLRKMHWTWITFPSIAVGASALAFLALSTGRVTGLNGNTVSIVSASAGGDEIAGLTFATVLSPSQTRYSVGIEGARASIAPREFDPLMRTPGAGPGWGASQCYVSPAGRRIDELLIRIWSAQTFEACWRAPAPALPRAKLSLDPSGRLVGEITNDTPYTLSDVTLIHGDSAWRLDGAMPPDKTVKLGPDGPRPQPLSQYAAGLAPSPNDSRESRRGMFGETSVKREVADAAARWVSLWTFARAGGKPSAFSRRLAQEHTYSDTFYDLARSVDVGDWLSDGHAVLLFSVDHPYVAIELSGVRPDFWNRTIVRIRVPVVPAAASEGDPS
ncbi:MAG: hypothetical protein V2A58_00830 [Planctomycetota bacterium]